MAATQVLLLKDVEKLGRSGDVCAVKPGFARNYLYPQGIAVVADKRTLRMQEKLQEERRKQAAEDRRASEEVAKTLEDIVVEMVVKVDPEGHMYGSVSALDLANELEQKSLKLDKKMIILKQPLKKLGTHVVSVSLKEGVEASFKVSIVSEEEANQEETDQNNA